ncbi:cytochrome C biogenesis protein CcmF [Pasteurellaceae bacterium RH1A]|nr:cytochrome C biogenesis protein CcmF [Pasteurellaceae bacterium RH1A]
MLPELGYLSLLIALSATVFLAVLPFCKFLAISTRLLHALSYLYAGTVTLSFIILAHAFATDDFSVTYVAQHSNTQLETAFKIGATWGGHEGSMLFWLMSLAIWTALFARFGYKKDLALHQQALGVMGLIGFAFCLFILGLSDPFDRLYPVPPQGRDLNPMLQDIGLIIHPPLLYLGYVGFAINFAIICAALLQGYLAQDIARACRRWVQISWGFLTAGIAVGSWWAYYELGWGGWWFWDPVENASLMPWLLATALMHVLIINQKRGIFSYWTVLLSILTFSLTLLGTFIVRSGVVTSVHAFAVDPNRGLALLAIFFAFTLGGMLLFALKARLNQPQLAFGFLSKENALLWVNILFSIAALIVLIGTFYPMLFNALGWGSISVGPPYFNTLFFPLIGLVLVLMIFSLQLKWKANLRYWKKPLAIMLVSMLLANGAIWLTIYKSSLKFDWLAWGFLSLAFSLTLNMLISPKIKSTPMRLGHLGLAVTVIGAVMSGYFGSEMGVRLSPNQSQSLYGYDFHYLGTKNQLGSNYTIEQAHFQVKKAGKIVAELYPERRYYDLRSMNMSEVGIDWGLLGDLYIVMGDKVGMQAYAFRLHYKPFVRWIWFGAALMMLGAFWRVKPGRKR